MHIAICDDERFDLDSLIAVLRQYDSKHQFKISCFSSASILLDAARDTLFDIAILDIEMTAPNGYDAAVELRKHTTPPLIIFITKSMEYTIQGYGVAFRYIPKPLTLEKLAPALDAAICEVQANRFTFSADGVSYILHMQDIYYLEVYNHVAMLHTRDSEYSLRASLKELLAQLPQGYFGMPHQSYVVNFTHIKAATAQQVVLTNGSRLPVSRRRQTEFMRQLHSYLGR